MVVGVLVIGLLALGGCQKARLGARCRTTDWGDDGGAWVLKCEKGRWKKAITKQQAAQILLALNAKKDPPPAPAASTGVTEIVSDPPPTAPPTTAPPTT